MTLKVSFLMDSILELEVASWQRRHSPHAAPSLCPLFCLYYFLSWMAFQGLFFSPFFGRPGVGFLMGSSKGRERGAVCQGELAKGVTLDNFVLNFFVISSKAISLTFSCGIWKGEKVGFFFIIFFPLLPLQNDLSGHSPKVNTLLSLINGWML